MSAVTITKETVRAAAQLLDLPLSESDCEAVAPRLADYVLLARQIVDAAATDILPTDDPRWFFDD